MTEDDKWDFINGLDEELLLGGVILSEWTTFLAKDAEIAFCAGANLSAILACQAAIESHLRFDYFEALESKGWGFYQLIEKCSLDFNLKRELHELRKYRNNVSARRTTYCYCGEECLKFCGYRSLRFL